MTTENFYRHHQTRWRRSIASPRSKWRTSYVRIAGRYGRLEPRPGFADFALLRRHSPPGRVFVNSLVHQHANCRFPVLRDRTLIQVFRNDGIHRHAFHGSALNVAVRNCAVLQFVSRYTTTRNELIVHAGNGRPETHAVFRESREGPSGLGRFLHVREHVAVQRQRIEREAIARFADQAVPAVLRHSTSQASRTS